MTNNNNNKKNKSKSKNSVNKALLLAIIDEERAALRHIADAIREGRHDDALTKTTMTLMALGEFRHRVSMRRL